MNPLFAASFWRNAGESLKHGVRLTHQKSHGAIIPSGLLRWSYGLAPDVSPPSKIDWRRGASRRRRRSNRGSSTFFFFRLTTLAQTEVTVMLMAFMMMMMLVVLMMTMTPMMTVSTMRPTTTTVPLFLA